MIDKLSFFESKENLLDSISKLVNCSPLINNKITMTFLPFLKELLGGVDVGKDGDKGDDET